MSLILFHGIGGANLLAWSMIRCCLRSAFQNAADCKLNGRPFLGSNQPVRTVCEVPECLVSVVPEMDYMVVGVGDPKDPKPRHSIGTRVVNYMAAELNGTEWKRDRELLARCSTVTLPNEKKLLLLKSSLPMKSMGRSAIKAVEKYLLTSRQVILVNGEFGMETGKLSWANSYTSTNIGVRSVLTHMRSPDFNRLSFGIGDGGLNPISSQGHSSRAPEQNERRVYAASVHYAAQTILDQAFPGIANAVLGKRRSVSTTGP